MKFTDELFRVTSARAVFETYLGRSFPFSKSVMTHCFVTGSHKNGDSTASLSIDLEDGLYHCFACSVFGDCVTLLVDLGLARSQKAAMDLLRAKYGLPALNGGGNGAAHAAAPKPQPPSPSASPHGPPPSPTAAANPWPWYPEEAEKLGWKIGKRNGRNCIDAGVLNELGTRIRTKIRYERDGKGPLGGFEDPVKGGPTGLLGDVVALRAAKPGSLVFVVAGETDLLCLKHHAEREGIIVRVISHSNGENAPFTERAEAVRGFKVALIYDADKTGRDNAPLRCAELRATALSVVDVQLPLKPGQKDLRDYLTSGGTVRELLKLADPPEPPVTVRTGTELLVAFHAGEIKPRPVLVAGLMRRGDIMIFFGPPGMGKSQLALAVAVCLSLGREHVQHIIEDDTSPIWELAADAPLRVLFVNGEDDEADLAERLAAYLKARGLPETLPNLLVYTPKDDERNLVAEHAQDHLEKLIVNHRAEILIVDNITNVLAGLKKNEEDAVSAWINRVPRRLRDRHGVTSILLGHTNKGTADGDARSSLERLFGSMAWGGCADGAVMLDWVPGEQKQRRLIHAKARGFAPFETVRVEAAKGDCVFAVIGKEDDQTQERSGPDSKVTPIRFIEALHPEGSVHARIEVADVLGVTDRHLFDLEDDLLLRLEGKVEKTMTKERYAKKAYRIVPLAERAAKQAAAGGGA